MNNRWLKSVPVFALTCALGIALTNSAFNRSRAAKGFSLEEARSHLHKQVRFNIICQSCPLKNEQTTGRTASVQKRDSDGQYEIAIDWDVSFRGKHEVLLLDKESYERVVIEVGPGLD